MLEIINLEFDYQERPLLKNISFIVPTGGLLHLKGTNGVGKTTLLKLIAGLFQPASGCIRFAGKTVSMHIAEYQHNLCFIGHKSGINPYLTLKENCYFDLNYQEDACDLEQLIEIFNLQNHWNQPCALLSAGQKRQVGLLKLWMSKAPLWLLDEPLVALDERAVALIMERIKLHRALGGTVVLTSHQTLPVSVRESSCMEFCL